MIRWNIEGCFWIVLAAMVLGFAVFCFYLLLLVLGDSHGRKTNNPGLPGNHLDSYRASGADSRVLHPNGNCEIFRVGAVPENAVWSTQMVFAGRPGACP